MESVKAIIELEKALREGGKAELADAVRVAIALVERGDTDALMEALAILDAVVGKRPE